MTLAENLMVPLSKLRHSLADAKVSSMLERIGLGDSASKRAGELSGGQRKLLEVVRAMMSEPRLLILDEPFSGTSSDVVDLMIRMIKEWAQQGTACLVISHDIVSMPRLCDDVVVLVGGAVLTSGKFADVRQDERVVEAYIGQ
jgi:ABC-type branched-subunit amino acid transport system ATPase component